MISFHYGYRMYNYNFDLNKKINDYQDSNDYYEYDVVLTDDETEIEIQTETETENENENCNVNDY